MSDRLVRPERTGWRDQALSARHRRWGFDAPAVDIDFLMLEYDSEKPCALIEYKAYQGRRINLDISGIRAVTVLANLARLPFFVVAYEETVFWAYVKPMNAPASEHLKGTTLMSEAQYVTLLYRLRQRAAPETVLMNCNQTKP
jgi:hypothetical protein